MSPHEAEKIQKATALEHHQALDALAYQVIQGRIVTVEAFNHELSRIAEAYEVLRHHAARELSDRVVARHNVGDFSDEMLTTVPRALRPHLGLVG